jgi:soluble lytic murein transglycosylase
VSTRTAHPTRRIPAARRAAVRRRRIVAVLLVAALAGLGVSLLSPTVHQAVQEIQLPLRHEDIIRQQAADKDLDPALVAAVIYAESRFVDGRTSGAGAEGLMQITPATAHDIAQRSGGTRFETSDLHDPQVNIAYGTWYLRHLLDRYGDDEVLALAAYNGGQGNVDKWIAREAGRDRQLTIDAIPFPETRAYVRKVLEARGQYQANYADELDP